jgi:hypothetical protein
VPFGDPTDARKTTRQPNDLVRDALGPEALSKFDRYLATASAGNDEAKREDG